MEWIKPALLVQHLRALDPGRFVELCNGLLTRAAARGQIDATHLELSLNLTDPDGGVDARCRDAPHPVGRVIPAPNVVYQFKGGARKRSGPEIAREDIAEKPRVREALAAGETLVYVAATDYGPLIASRVRAALTKNHGITISDEQLIIINGETLAHELQGFPALVASFLGLDERLFPLDQWSRFPPLTNAFQRDADLEARIRDLGAQIAPARSVTHVVGAAGNGKTRVVLETLRGSGLAADVLYARQADDVSAAVWAHLRNTPDAQCTLVLDEVDDVQGAELRDYFALTGPGVRLVMVGRDASGRAKPGTVRVEGLNEDLLVRAIEAVAPGLPNEAAREIASVCERSPKLAVLLAERVRDDPRLVEHYRRLADPEIRGVLERFLPLEEDDVLALSTVALLEHVGWNDEASAESAALFEFVGLDPIAARDRVQRLDDQFGIAPLVGRYRYVSPEILADHLAARQLNAWPADKFREVFDRLGPRMTASLAARVRRLAGVLANARTVEEVILGDQGPFRTLADTEKGLATLLPELVGPFPRASLRALRRLIDPASDAELRAATSIRRYLVNTLTELLWSEDTFEDAATLLLRLAVNEIEEFANNATGIFVEAFQTHLGRTAAGPEVRARILRRAAASGNAREREVAAMAIEAGLKTRHVHRMGMPPRGVPGMPEREWRPKTYGEWYDAIEAYLGILPGLLKDGDAAVRIAAVEALAEATVLACDVSRLTDAWLAVARHVVGADFDLRAKLLEAIEHELERVRRRDEPEEVKELTEEERTRLRTAQTERTDRLRAFHDELAGADFSSRFRRALTRAPWASVRGDLEEEARQIREEIKGIAAEVVRDPELLDGEWDWLLAGHGNQPEQFSELLGRADRDRRLADRLSAMAVDNDRAKGWLSLYEIGYGLERGDPDHIDRVAAALIGDSTRAAQLFDMLMRAGHSHDRARVIADLFKSKAISGRLITSLGYSSWRTGLTPAEALEVASAAAADPEATAALVTFLGHYLHDASAETRRLFREIVLRVLVAPRADDKRRTFDWEWDELAKVYAEEAPLEVAAALLGDIAGREYAHDRMLDAILQQTWAAAPDKRRFFIEVLAPWLDAQTSGGWWVRQALEHFPVEEVGVDFLTAWVAEKPEPRAHNLADILGEPLGRPSALHAALLERFADYGVGDVFFGSLISGTWSGSASSWSKGRLAEAKKWLEDERPVIREWAKRAVTNLEQMVEHDVVRDAEDQLHRR